MSSILLIHLTLLFTSSTLAIIFFMAWQTMGRQTYTLIWAGTFLVTFVQRIFNIYKEDITPHSLYWMIVCFLSVMSVVLGAWGHFLRTGTRVNYRFLVGSVVAVMLLVFYFTVVEPHVGLQMSIYVYYNAVLLMVVGVVILRHKEKSLPAEIGVSVSYLLLAAFQFAAATFALLQGRDLDPIFRELYIFLNFVSLPAAFTAMGLFVVFMLASDLSEGMKRLAMTDDLTRCLNRRGFYSRAQEQIKKLFARGQHVCLVYWDIDKFKNINDQYGHAAGDKVLADTVALVQGHIKSTDLLGRLGGEEFVILLGRADAEEARHVAERLRDLIEQHPVKFQSQALPVTASFGVVFIDQDTPAVEKAIDRADQALYQAKSEGRNQVVLAC